MKSFLTCLFLVLITKCPLRCRPATVAVNDNREHFGILCRIYNLAKKTVEHSGKTPEVTKIRDEIDIINASLSNTDWFKEIESADDPKKLSEEFKAKNGEIEENWGRWKAAVQGVLSSQEFKKLPPEGVSLRVAQRKLEGIERRVEKIIKDLQKYNASKQVATANSKFLKAIYGETDPGDKAKPLNGKAGSRLTDCSSRTLSTAGALAGKSLAADFYCLCARYDTGDSSGLSDACGIVGGDASNYWGGSLTEGTGGFIWDKIKAGCEDFPQPNAWDPASARKAIEDFRHALAVGGTSSIATQKKKPGMLGTMAASSTGGCDGQKANSAGTEGVCVYYGKPENWKDIDWLKRMEEGLDALDQIRTDSATQKDDMRSLLVLQSHAEEIYKEAKARLEVEKNNHLKPAQNPSGDTYPTEKSTAQEAGTVSAATIRRFILPWTLLI